MTRHLLLAAAGLALAAATPAGATDLQLRLDLGYDRVDQLDAGGGTGQRLDFDAGLSAGGWIFAPGSLDWSLGAGWHGLRSTAIGGQKLDSNRLSYGARLGVLQRPSSPLALVLRANRSETDFTSDSGLARATGTLTTTSWSADAAYRSLLLPALRLGVARTTTEDSGLGRAPSERNSWRFHGGTGHATTGYSINADYDGERSDGTYDTDNFDTHSVFVNASANVGPSVDARLTERYYLRLPTRLTPFNPRYEDNSLFASVNWSAPDALSRTAYRFGHTLITAPTVADRERSVNALSEQYEQQVSAPLRLIGIASVSASEDRLAAAVTRATGGSATGLARWTSRHGEADLFAQGGGSAGFLQADGQSTRTAWGLQGEAGLSGPVLRARGGARYGASYQTNLGAVGGWALHQSLTGEWETRPAPDLTLRLSIQLTADRLHSDAFGGGANRLVQLVGNSRWRRLFLDLVAGVSSGILGAPSGGVHGDGLFVPAPFNTHNLFGSATATLEVFRGLQLNLRSRYLDLRQPDRDRQYELGVLGGVSYVAGALTLSLEDEYVTGGGGRATSQNRVLVRATRAFGARF